MNFYRLPPVALFCLQKHFWFRLCGKANIYLVAVFEFDKFNQSVSQVVLLLLIVFIMHFVAQREYICT
jgi:hypothetical protein